MTPSYLRLSERDLINASKQYGIELAALKAIMDVESGKHGFWVLAGFKDPVPVINFEHHYFSRLTRRIFDRSHPNVSKPALDHKYGPGEWLRLREAIRLDRSAALQSASWGLFQVMGAHWKELGYESIEEMVSLMHRHERDQLDCGLRYIKNFGLIEAVQDHDWRKFARLYNGAGYLRHKYHIRLANAYANNGGEG